MLVIAVKGSRCPMESKPRQFITDTEPIDVPGTAYYRRLVMEGSIEAVDQVPSETVPARQKTREKPVTTEASMPGDERGKNKEGLKS